MKNFKIYFFIFLFSACSVLSAEEIASSTQVSNVDKKTKEIKQDPVDALIASLDKDETETDSLEPVSGEIQEIDSEVKLVVDKAVDEVEQKDYEKQHIKLEKQIDKEIKTEIQKQAYEVRKSALKDDIYGRVKLKELKDDDFIYKIPTWPFHSIFYAEKDLVEFSLDAKWLNKAYNSSGHTVDIASLIFGRNSFELQDMLLISKLLRAGKIDQNDSSDGIPTPGHQNGTPGSQYHYFYVLADQPLKFHASTDMQTFAAKYARHFWDGRISFGLEIPIVRRKNKIELQSNFSDSVHGLLSQYHPHFFDTYDSLDDFVETILSANNIGYNKRDTEVGLGDISVFINTEIKSRYFERFIFGFKALFPTSNDKIAYELWKPQLGNGGFVELSLFSSFLWGVNDFINPHIFTEVTGSIPANVVRRVPQKVTYDVATTTPINSLLKMATSGSVYKLPFSEDDVTVRNCATEARSVRVRRGPQVFARFGNQFENVFSKKSFLDIYYDVRLKAKDYISRGNLESKYDTTMLTYDTYELANRLGLTYLYQFDSRKRIDVGASYLFTGQNVPRTLELYAAFSIEF